MRTRLTALWRGFRARRPEAAEAVLGATLALRGRNTLISEVRSLQQRLHAAERDAELLAAHVAALTARVEQADGPAEVGERLAAARLGALASYEQRIATLEEGLRPARHASAHAAAATAPRTLSESEVNGR